MENPGYIALSRMIAQEHALQVRANNIANTGTPGYKGESLVFSDYLVRQNGINTPPGGQNVQMVQDRTTYRDFSQGQFSKTGNPLDLALQGDGFFVVSTPQGERYTRAGRFSLSPTGQVVDMSGNTVLGPDSQPIAVPPGSTGLSVGANGDISTSNGPVGKFQVVQFDDQQALQAEGSTLFSSSQPSQPVTQPKIIQGMIEEANIQPVVELTAMMSEMRDFEFASQISDGESQREQTAIDRIGHRQ